MLQNDSRSLRHGDENGWLAQVAGIAARTALQMGFASQALINAVNRLPAGLRRWACGLAAVVVMLWFEIPTTP